MMPLDEARRGALLLTQPRRLIGWLGPRGLNSLLLALLVVEAGVTGSQFLLGVVGIVVTVSVVAHGATQLSRRYGEAVMSAAHEEEWDNAAGIFECAASACIRISPKQDHSRVPGAVRITPDEVDEWEREASGSQVESQCIAVYCT